MFEISKKNIRRIEHDDRSQVFTDEETEKILNICEEDGSLTSLGIELAAYTGIRTVILSKDALDILQKIKTKYEDGSDYIFYNQMHSGAFTNRLYRICDKLGIKKRSLHKLRKTYATKLINANIPESIIIGQLGHTDISTTRNHYYYDNYTLAEKQTFFNGDYLNYIAETFLIRLIIEREKILLFTGKSNQKNLQK